MQAMQGKPMTLDHDTIVHPKPMSDLEAQMPVRNLTGHHQGKRQGNSLLIEYPATYTPARKNSRPRN